MALLPASSQLIKISSKLCITVTVLVTVLITDRWKELPTNCKRFSKGCKLIIGWIPLIPLSRFFLSQCILYVGQNRSFLEWGKGVIACCRIKCFNFHDQWKYEIKTPVNCFFFCFSQYVNFKLVYPIFGDALLPLFDRCETCTGPPFSAIFLNKFILVDSVSAMLRYKCPWNQKKLQKDNYDPKVKSHY